MNHRSVVLLLSGGQDSTTCLMWALAQGVQEVLCLSLWYGQRHDVEMESARAVVGFARSRYPDAVIDHEEVPVGKVLNSTSPLVSDRPVGQYDSVADLPGGVEPTFVPGRNVLFLTIAANRAAERGATAILSGLCQEDFGGYPDCRRAFVDKMEAAIAEGFVGQERYLPILTPLMDLSKAESVALARDLPHGLDALAFSHTCYNGAVPPCGRCHACHLRARGFEQAGVVDPLIARVGVT